jgi:hypothetical protein
VRRRVAWKVVKRAGSKATVMDYVRGRLRPPRLQHACKIVMKDVVRALKSDERACA